jgi:hypothetical protein
VNPRTRLLLATGAMMGSELPPPGKSVIAKYLEERREAHESARKAAPKPKG